MATTFVLLPTFERPSLVSDQVGRITEALEGLSYRIVIIDAGRRVHVKLNARSDRVSIVSCRPSKLWNQQLRRGVDHVIRFIEPEDQIVLLNDDVAYDPQSLRTLQQSQRENPKKIIAGIRQGSRVPTGETDALLPAKELTARFTIYPAPVMVANLASTLLAPHHAADLILSLKLRNAGLELARNPMCTFWDLLPPSTEPGQQIRLHERMKRKSAGYLPAMAYLEFLRAYYRRSEIT